MAQKLVQFAAMPYRLVQDELRILLVTSRDTRRWILPKGRPEKGIPSYEVAALEAFEEAGVSGRVSSRPIGRFSSVKHLRSGREIPTWVQVYLLDVETEHNDWPEMGQRERQWATPDTAAGLVQDNELVTLIHKFDCKRKFV